MTSQLLASELTNLVQESKRKHNDLRQVSLIPPPNSLLCEQCLQLLSRVPN